MTRSLSVEELAAESGVPRERIDWLTGIGILHPLEADRFTFADGFRVRLVNALLAAGFLPAHIEWAASEGVLNLENVDDYLSDPGPRSERTFGQLAATAGPRGSLLSAIYGVLGLPVPASSSRLRRREEELLEGFVEGWELAPSDETLIRAARLIGEGARLIALGWAGLVDEQLADPARQRLVRGEIDRFPDEVRASFAAVFRLAPDLTVWLLQRHVEQRTVSGIVDGLEEFFGARGLAPAPQPTAPPSVAFVDLSGYTRTTEEQGDEVAVGLAAALQRRAEAAATASGGRLVKLLGDGAMLCFPDARLAVEAAVALVETLRDELGLSAHAGVHSGPVVERDLDLFGRTVNLASRLAGAARPGEVLVTETVMEAVNDPAPRFQRVQGLTLEGIAEPVAAFRVSSDPG